MTGCLNAWVWNKRTLWYRMYIGHGVWMAFDWWSIEGRIVNSMGIFLLLLTGYSLINHSDL